MLCVEPRLRVMIRLERLEHGLEAVMVRFREKLNLFWISRGLKIRLKHFP